MTYTLYQLNSKSTRVASCKNTNDNQCNKVTYKGTFNRDLTALDSRGLPVADRVGGLIEGHNTYQDSIVSGFKCDTDYYFMILATNNVGDGHMSNENDSPIGFRTTACSKPNKMVTPSLVERKTSSIVLDWSIPTNDDHTYDLGGAEVEYFEIALAEHRVGLNGVPVSEEALTWVQKSHLQQ